MKYKQEIELIAKAIKENDNFAVFGHVRPDGDCLGSQTAMYLALKQLGKKVRMFNVGPIQEYYSFVAEIDKVETKLPEDTKIFGASIFLDCGDPDRVERGFKFEGFSITIDHHQKNHEFANINYIDPCASCVGEQLYAVFKELGIKFTKDISNSLYLSFLADTGSFKFSNTSANVFNITSKLVSYGAEPSKIATAYFDNISRESIYLTAAVLSNIKFECDGKLAWSEITKEQYHKHGGDKNEPEGLASVLRGIKGVVVSALIHELDEGGLRVGFRSKNSYDVSQIARKFGGGGHINASGCFILGNYETLKKQIIEALKEDIANKNL